MLKTLEKKKIKKIIKISDAISKNNTSQKRKNWETFFSNYSIVPALHTMQSVAHTCVYYIYNYSKYNSFSIYSNFMNEQYNIYQ